MRKHLLRLLITYTCFELMRRLGGELPEFFRGEKIFTWIDETDKVTIITSNFIIFLLYPLTSFIIFENLFRVNKRKAIFYSLIAGLSIIIFRYLVQEVLFSQWFGFHNYYAGVPLLYYFIDNFYFAIVYSAFGILYFLLQNEQRYKLEHRELQLANKQSQLSFLQSQVNPHFLFNNLNNIYALVYLQSPQSLEAISKLSEILRYMIYENHEKVTLSLELSYIQKFIDIQQLRTDKSICIEQTLKGDPSRVMIPPLILIPFVENAFKHGDWNKSETPIRMALNVSNDTIDFFMTNRKAYREKDSAGGIGLQNIQKRLALLYPGRHQLQIEETAEIFTITLQLIN